MRHPIEPAAPPPGQPRRPVLFLSEVAPFRRNNGQREKIHHVLQCLAELHDVTAVFLYRSPEELDGMEAYAFRGGMETIQLPPALGSPYLDQLLGRFRAAAGVARQLEALLQRVRPAVAWLEYGYLGQYLGVLRRHRVPTVYVSHNAEAELFVRLWRDAPLSRRKIGQVPFLLANHLHERVYFRQVGRFVCISELDRDRYARWLDPERLSVLPNFKDGREYDAVLPHAPGHPYLVHVGGLDAAQNRDGALFVMKEVWPAIRAAHPELRLYLVGRPPPAAARASFEECARQAGGVVLTGEVESTAPYVKGATAALVPTLVGSGTRTKIVEAAACGVPSVSTSKGAEGLPFVNGDSILVADDPAQFAALATRVVEDPAFRAAVAARAKQVFEAELGHRPNLLRIAALVESIAG